MMEYKPIRGNASIYMLLIAILSNLFIAILLKLVNSYLVYSIMIVALVLIDLYYLYYLVMDFTLRYSLADDDHLIVNCFWKLKKVDIDLKEVRGFMCTSSNIHGIKLSGIGNDKFAYGRNIIDKIGTTYMFVSSSKDVIYLKTGDICYAISSAGNENIRAELKKCSVTEGIEEFVETANAELHKDKKFFIPFIVVSLLIVVMILNPFILYLRNRLPGLMPLTFDTSFLPLQEGTGKQFAFKQMTYGVLNMIILFCMYYASYFCAKYDRKTAYRYIYISLVIVLVFLFLQIRILTTFI
ncbi:MAG: PH domain-containing protein [Bacillota bacterium]|nr:PH domain-containing protein [Bacillota bacterium]